MKYLIAPFCAAVVVCAAACLPAVAQGKPAAPRTLKVNLNYTGAGPVDNEHRIFVFLFDRPEFVHAGPVEPVARLAGISKDAVVTFPDTGMSPVYVGTAYDPAGRYSGQSGPPPPGASLGMYSRRCGVPAAVKIAPGKVSEIRLTFDDTSQMP